MGRIGEKFRNFRIWLADKVWRGRSPDEILAKRSHLFVLIGFLLIGIFALYRYFIGITFLPNFELIIPTLVVTGSISLSLYHGASRFWRKVNQYFGVLAIISYLVVMTLVFGIRLINIFVGTGFIFVWLLAMRNDLSLLDNFKKLLVSTTITAAAAILLYDFWTGIVGFPLLYGASVWTAFLSQIPFTFYHLASLVFIPPLVGLGKLMVRVKVPVRVAVAARNQVRAQER